MMLDTPAEVKEMIEVMAAAMRRSGVYAAKIGDVELHLGPIQEAAESIDDDAEEHQGQTGKVDFSLAGCPVRPRSLEELGKARRGE